MGLFDINMRNAVGELRIGIDAGSKTVKAVVVDERDVIVGSMYHRHRLDVRASIAETIRTLSLSYKIKEARVAFTGSAAIDLSGQLGVPFVQEVIATTDAVNKLVPQADVVIELGGEDTKIIYLTGEGGVEQRMNATCAGGTGSFIESAAHMVGVRTGKVSKLALGAHHIYPIASRCAVFAQNDIRPLLNAGVSRADIAMSALVAVARQAVGGLACGRPIRGNIVLLGGAIQWSPAVRLAFDRVLRDMGARIVIPSQPHLVTALGCALAARDSEKVSLAELEQRVTSVAELKDNLDRLPALFDSPAERAAFEERHATGDRVRRGSFEDAGAEVFVGLDAGSTSVKCAVVDADGKLLMSDYVEAEGETLEVAREMMAKAQRTIRANGAQCRVGRALVTGYGEDLLKCGLGFDAGVVETAAHLRAALELRPDATFVLDIGGQDMKALWVRDGVVVDAVLNEACSSGCGAFVGGSARSLDMTQDEFTEAALEASSPIDLGTKCTVFMTSRVRHAQKVGADKGDIAAGIAYSVVNNALVRIIGEERAATMGPVAVVQGGTFISDAVLRAFEKVTGATAIRPDIAHLMGAYGAALLARDEWARQRETAGGNAEVRPSGLLGAAELEALDPVRRAIRCSGCGNNCRVTLMDFGDGRRFASGNKCDKVFASSAGLSRAERELIPNAAQAERELLSAYATCASEGPRGGVRVGVANVLDAYEHAPFWHTLLRHLGFSVLMPDDTRYEALENLAAETIPSESVCSPAKLAHLRYLGLVEDGADAVLMARFERGRRCAVASTYASALADNVGTSKLCCPALPCGSIRALADDDAALDALMEALSALAPDAPIERAELDAALDAAFAEQDAFEAKVRAACDDVLAWLAADPSRHAAALACRPYHVDPALLHGIDEMMQSLGFAVIVPLGIDRALSPERTGAWDVARGLRRVVAFADAHPQIDAVAIRSFGCGYDAAACAEVHREHPFTELKIDDMVDTSHIRIRLRTLAETRGVQLSDTGSTPQEAVALTVPDACSTLRELLSRANAGAPVPETCVRCLTYLADREAAAAGTPGAFWPAAKRPADPSRTGPLVGLVGNPLLVFDEDANEHVAELLEELGCNVAMPEPDLMRSDDVRYLEQLDAFRKAGVDIVVYLQSFGCLKGHVQSRGAAHELARRYPDMPVTIVDYDPDSSALNRENRIRLAVEAARRRKEKPAASATAAGTAPAPENAERENHGYKISQDSGKASIKGSGKVFYDTVHRRIVSLVPLEDLSSDSRALVDPLLELGFTFELDHSPRFESTLIRHRSS